MLHKQARISHAMIWEDVKLRWIIGDYAILHLQEDDVDAKMSLSSRERH